MSKLKHVNKKFMHSNTYETTGLIASTSSHLTQNFGHRDIKLALRKMHATWSVLARLMRSLACFKAKRINKKCMYSNTYETNGVIACMDFSWTHNFGHRDSKLLCTENAMPSSVLARLMRALAFLEAKSSNKKFMCSDIDETNGVNCESGIAFDSQLWPLRQLAGSAENAATSSVLARLMRALACFGAKKSNKKFMCSDTDETNGDIANWALHQTHNFGH